MYIFYIYNVYFHIHYEIFKRKTINNKIYNILSCCVIRILQFVLSVLYENVFYLEKEIYVIGFSYPVVPKGKARIRVQISAAHSDEDIDRAVNAFIQIGKELAVI